MISTAVFYCQFDITVRGDRRSGGWGREQGHLPPFPRFQGDRNDQLKNGQIWSKNGYSSVDISWEFTDLAGASGYI